MSTRTTRTTSPEVPPPDLWKEPLNPSADWFTDPEAAEAAAQDRVLAWLSKTRAARQAARGAVPPSAPPTTGLPTTQD